MTLPVILVALPLVIALAVYILPEARRPLALAGSAGVLAAVVATGQHLMAAGPWRYPIGGWETPPGIALSVDALVVVMLGMTAVVAAGATVYALGYWRGPERGRGVDMKERAFWPLWWMLWAGLNALFLAGDAFNAYVCLEVVGLSAVALVAVAGEGPALRAALRYLLVSLAGSLLYLAGVALLYGEYAVLDLEALGEAVESGWLPATSLALASAGLALKTALFPLHFWLPPAHGHAPAPVSAVLSALVVKGGLYLLLRYWAGVFAALDQAWGALLLAALGAVAVVWGSFQALAATRLKLLVAYSTVAQLGYLFLAFPLVVDPHTAVLGREALLYLVLAHALAKGAAFLAAGTLLWATGTDRIADLGGVLPSFPVTTAAFALAGVSLIGLPPTGGFVGKWLLLEGLIASGLWAGLAVVAAGTFLASGYVFRVLVHTFRAEGQTAAPILTVQHRPGRVMEWTALGLALAALGVGFLAPVLEPVLAAAGRGL